MSSEAEEDGPTKYGTGDRRGLKRGLESDHAFARHVTRAGVTGCGDVGRWRYESRGGASARRECVNRQFVAKPLSAPEHR